MGFWGTYIVTRAAQPLTGLPALQAAAEDICWHGRGDGGWQAVQVHRGPAGWESADLPAAWEETLRALMKQSGGPVLAAVVLDSDGAQLIGYSPRQGRWGGWLALDAIIGHIDPDGWPGLDWVDDEEEPRREDDETYLPRYRAVVGRLSAAAGPPGEAAVPGLLGWAAEAGLEPDTAGVSAALDGHREIFAEDLFFALLAALGVPELAGADA
jgi:hypothetical protein